MRQFRTSIVALCVVFFILPGVSAHAQTTWHVNAANCPGPGDGSLGNPFCSIQDAIDASALSGDEIIVAQGFYQEQINFNGKAVDLHSTDPLDPIVVATTIISGNAMGSVVTCTTGEGPGSILDGFIITGGSAAIGGGMFNNTASPTVANCVFTSNSATFGGGMYNSLGSNPTVINCQFINKCPIAFIIIMKILIR